MTALSAGSKHRTPPAADCTQPMAYAVTAPRPPATFSKYCKYEHEFFQRKRGKCGTSYSSIERFPNCIGRRRSRASNQLEMPILNAFSTSSGGSRGPIRPWAPIQSDSLAINFEFDIIRKMHTLWLHVIDSQEN